MFLTLLAVTFIISTMVTIIVAKLFNKPIRVILDRIVGDMAEAWHRYVTFAIYVVGISGGVAIWDLEKYITPRAKDDPIVILSRDRWVLEVYRTIIGTLQSTAWMLLAFFVVTLIAFAIVKFVNRKEAAAVPAR